MDQLFFRRKFAITLFKNKKLKLLEMSFYKDFITDKRGAPYPLLEKQGELSESVFAGKYRAVSGENGTRATRLLGAYFPYATYEMRVETLDGFCGFSFRGDTRRADLLFCVEDSQIVCLGGGERLESGIRFSPGTALLVTCRRDEFDVYVRTDDFPQFIGTVTQSAFADTAYEAVFTGMTAAVTVGGRDVVLTDVQGYLDCGVSQADIRPIRYENGEIMTENGKTFLTVSLRMQKEQYQGVFSWIPGTAEFELTGALFFDVGDGLWGNDVASSVLYHRTEKLWYLWVCSFSHGHILAYAKIAGELRFGLNVVDVTRMEELPADGVDTDFLGKEGDEDPDFLYDEASGKWWMTVCRLVQGNYRYFLFESQHPFEGYRYVTNTASGSETGGSLVPTEEGLCFVCGSMEGYHVYRLPDMTDVRYLRCDYADGGFRGWGTVMPLWIAGRRKYYWLTFDRHNAGDYTWSYGNIYCYEA